MHMWYKFKSNTIKILKNQDKNQGHKRSNIKSIQLYSWLTYIQFDLGYILVIQNKLWPQCPDKFVRKVIRWSAKNATFEYKEWTDCRHNHNHI